MLHLTFEEIGLESLFLKNLRNLSCNTFLHWRANFQVEIALGFNHTHSRLQYFKMNLTVR